MVDFISNGRWIDDARFPPKNRAASTIYVDSATGSDAAVGDMATPLLTLKEAVARVPDGYSGGVFTIQCLGAGPYTMPETYPAMGDSGSVNIMADRSSPLLTNASPTFAAVAGKAAQYEDTSFGAHSGLADGYAWAELDMGAFSSGLIEAGPVLNTGAGSTLALLYGSTGLPTNVHEYTTTLNILSACVGGPPDRFAGVRFIGFIVDFASTGLDAQSSTQNMCFRGCKFEGVCTLIDCMFGGYADSAVTSWDCFGSGAAGSQSGPINLHWAASSQLGFFTEWGGIIRFRESLLEQTITIGASAGSTSLEFTACDLEKAGGTCIHSIFDSFSSNNSVRFVNGDLATSGATTLISGDYLDIVFARVVTGSTSSTCIVLGESCTVKNAELYLDGVLTNSGTPGNEIQVGTGAPIDAFVDLPITDATTFCSAN